MARMRGGLLLLLGPVLATAPACTRLDNALASVPAFAFLRSSPAFDPYEATRPAPPGAVPYRGPQGAPLPPTPATEAGLREFAAGPYGTNPFPVDDALLAQGRTMYDRHCMACHGPGGAGDGPIVGEGRYPPIARNLLLPAAVELPDGYIYGIVRVGRGLMPAYGSKTTHRERWAITEYLRQLQRQAGVLGQAGPAAAATGGE
jgi:mono/diheme cytochrome c family protein